MSRSAFGQSGSQRASGSSSSQAPLVGQFDRQRGDERLGDAGDRKRRAPGHWSLRRAVRDARSAGPESLAGDHDRRRHAGEAGSRALEVKDVLQRPVETGIDALVSAMNLIATRALATAAASDGERRQEAEDQEPDEGRSRSGALAGRPAHVELGSPLIDSGVAGHTARQGMSVSTAASLRHGARTDCSCRSESVLAHVK